MSAFTVGYIARHSTLQFNIVCGRPLLLNTNLENIYNALFRKWQSIEKNSFYCNFIASKCRSICGTLENQQNDKNNLHTASWPRHRPILTHENDAFGSNNESQCKNYWKQIIYLSLAKVHLLVFFAFCIINTRIDLQANDAASHLRVNTFFCHSFGWHRGIAF